MYNLNLTVVVLRHFAAALNSLLIGVLGGPVGCPLLSRWSFGGATWSSSRQVLFSSGCFFSLSNGLLVLPFFSTVVNPSLPLSPVCGATTWKLTTIGSTAIY
uniref:(northern house mosquito) hypothetical protein n=1 Tax=Culex pipiens TaxID=7175 RepID=A0A8D8H8D9_CULPI